MDSRGSVRSGVVCFGCCVAKGVEAACLRWIVCFVGGGGPFGGRKRREQEKRQIEEILATMMTAIYACISSSSLSRAAELLPL